MLRDRLPPDGRWQVAVALKAFWMYQLPLSPPLSLKRKYLFLSLKEEEKTFLNGSKGYSKGTKLIYSQVIKKEAISQGPCNCSKELQISKGQCYQVSTISFSFLRFYLFILERWEGREKEREKHQCARDTLIGCLWHAPNWGYGQRPRYVLWQGIEPVMFLFTGQRSVCWATPATAKCQLFPGWC